MVLDWHGHQCWKKKVILERLNREFREWWHPQLSKWNGIFLNLCLFTIVAAPPAEAPIQENGEANGEVKEPVDPNAPKKCDVIVISGRKERCEGAVEALKVLHKDIIRELGSISQNRCFVP